LQVRTSVSVAEWQTVFVSSTSEESRRYRENENNVAFFWNTCIYCHYLSKLTSPIPQRWDKIVFDINTSSSAKRRNIGVYSPLYKTYKNRATRLRTHRTREIMRGTMVTLDRTNVINWRVTYM